LKEGMKEGSIVPTPAHVVDDLAGNRPCAVCT
jgi:hypothetical protein